MPLKRSNSFNFVNKISVRNFCTFLITSVIFSFIPNISSATDDGLVINLDASNSSSYSGTGSTWTNLVGGTNYTISNGTFQDSGGIKSILFNGSSTFVPIGSAISANSNFTKEAWVYDNGVGSSRNIISSASNVLFLSGSTLYGGVGGAYTLVSSNSFPTGVWKHVVLTFDDDLNTMRLFIDGVQVSQNTNVSNRYLAETERIGAHYSSSEVSFWNGKISKVKVYSTALCPAQVVSSFNTDATYFSATRITSASTPCVISSSVTESAGVVSVSGNVTLDGGASVTERGFVYGNSSLPTTSNNKISIGTGTGAFSGTSSTLSTGTYYFRAFATNSSGTSYGAQTTVTIVASSLSPSTQTITGSVNSAITNSSTITASNFTGSVSYAITSGTLPTGLSLNSSTGVISGTPTALSSNTITVTGTGATSGSATTSVTFNISAVAPSAPVINSITAGDGQLSVNFTASANGGSAITNYKYSTDGSTYTAFSPTTTTSPLVITGLTNATSYPVTIKAVNAINDSSASNSITATPAAATSSSSGGGSSSPGSSAPPTPTPTPSVSTVVKPRVERINTNPLNIAPTDPEVIRNIAPGSKTNPEQLFKGAITELSEILKPKVVDLAKIYPDTKFDSLQALQLVTVSQDKKVVDLPSLVTNDDQPQASRIVIVNNTSAQVITTTGGVLTVESKSDTTPIPVDSRGRVQMVKDKIVVTQGQGLSPNTEFAVFLFSEPTLLGIGMTDSQGRYFASFTVENELPNGDHTLQIKGSLANGQISSVSMPVSVVESIDIATEQAMPKTIFVDVNPVENALDAVYWIFFVLLFMLVLIALANRKRFVRFIKNQISE